MTDIHARERHLEEITKLREHLADLRADQNKALGLYQDAADKLLARNDEAGDAASAQANALTAISLELRALTLVLHTQPQLDEIERRIRNL